MNPFIYLCLGLILCTPFGQAGLTDGGVLVIKLYNRYGCRTTGYYKPVCNAPVFFYDKVNEDGTFNIVIQERGGPADSRRRKWELVPAGGENRFYIRICGACSHGPCCFYWHLKRHFTYSEVVAQENPDDSPKRKTIFHIASSKGGYTINACNDFDSCRYELTWATWRGKSHLKWLYCHHYPKAALIVEFVNLYGCDKDEYSYSTACKQRVFLWNQMYDDGTFPIVFQERGGSIHDTARTTWELVPVSGYDNHYYVRLCGRCSYGACCVYWGVKKHWTYSELIATYDHHQTNVFKMLKDGRGFKIYYCKHPHSCKYELTWEYLSGQHRVKWLSFQHYRSEGVKWHIKVKKYSPHDYVAYKFL